MSSSATRERELRDGAMIEAQELFAHHGGGAIEILSERLVDQSRSPEQRRADRLAMLAVEKLDRDRRRTKAPQALVVWKPSLFSLEGVAALFGFKRRRARR